MAQRPVSHWSGMYSTTPAMVPVFMRPTFELPPLGQFRDYSPWELLVTCPSGCLPSRSTEKAAGYDLYSPADENIPSKGSVVIDTGVSMALPSGHYGKIEGRSGLAITHDIIAFGGVIDEDYRGPVAVKLFNMGTTDYKINKGDRIAQIVIQPYANLNVRRVDTLNSTARGYGGFGSTGR